jgi:Golgi SNAP receptor complex protein 2
MESLYHSTNRGLREVQDGMLQLESLAFAFKGDEGGVGHGGGEGGEFVQLQRDLHRRVEQILSNLDRLDVLVSKEPVTRRQNAKVRVEQLKEDVRHLQAALRATAVRIAKIINF